MEIKRDVFSEAGSFLFGQPRQFIPIGDTRIVMTRPFLIPAMFNYMQIGK